MVNLPLVWKPGPLPQRLFFDMSSHQGIVNFDKMLLCDPEPEAFYIRGGIGSWYIDSKLVYLYALAAEREKPVAIYHVWHPTASWEDHIRHLERLYKLVRPIKEPDGPPIVDIEIKGNVSLRKYSTRLEHYVQTAELAVGRRAAAYSRVEFLRSNVEALPWMARTEWIFAQYTWTGREHAGPYTRHPMIPPSQVVAMQTSKRGDGRYYGCQSKALDYDRWQLDDTAWQRFWDGS